MSTEKKALTLKAYEKRCAKLAKDIDDYKYNHSLIAEIGKPLASALNDLASAHRHLREAASEQAFKDLEEMHAERGRA